MEDIGRMAAVVILYHPPGNVLSNIMSYYEFVDEMFVFDNTEEKTSIKDQLAHLPKIKFYHDGENLGIATRLNTACNLAVSSNCSWLLTMDQDTSFSEEAITNYVQCFLQFTDKQNVAMFGTAYSKEKKESSSTCVAVQSDNLITSAMLLNLSLVKKIGSFDENLFIDSVDHDYCIRAKNSGYKLIQFTNIFIQHNLGEEVCRSSIKTLFTVKKKKIIHSPQRCYYMYRNMLYLVHKHKDVNNVLVNKLKKIVTGNLKASLFYSGNFFAILRYLVLAHKHYRNMNMGKGDK